MTFTKKCLGLTKSLGRQISSKFDKLKQQLLQLRIVRLPDFECHFILKTDGSRVESGVILKQRFD